MGLVCLFWIRGHVIANGSSTLARCWDVQFIPNHRFCAMCLRLYQCLCLCFSKCVLQTPATARAATSTGPWRPTDTTGHWAPPLLSLSLSLSLSPPPQCGNITGVRQVLYKASITSIYITSPFFELG